MIMVNQTLCRPWRTQQHSRWICPEESCSLWRSHGRAPSCQELPENLLQHGTAAHGGFLEKTHTGAVLEEPQPMRGTHVRAISERLYLMGGTLHWRWERELKRKEHQRHGLTTAPIPSSPYAVLQGWGKTGGKADPEEEGKGGFVLFLTILLFY